jgi:hypothetical protein
VARQAERAEQVVTTQQLLAQAAVQGAAEEAGGDEEHADAARDQQVERAAHEIGVGALLFIKLVGILAGHLAALAVGRVGDDEADRPLEARAVLTDPALEGHMIEVDVGSKCAQQRGADF